MQSHHNQVGALCQIPQGNRDSDLPGLDSRQNAAPGSGWKPTGADVKQKAAPSDSAPVTKEVSQQAQQKQSGEEVKQLQGQAADTKSAQQAAKGDQSTSKAPDAKPAQNAGKGEQLQGEDAKLSPAELKKRAKAEKQARRAAEKEQRGTGGAEEAATNGASAQGAPKQQKTAGDAKSKSNQQQQHTKGQQTPAPLQKQGEHQPQHKRTGSQAAPPTPSFKRRPSQSEVAQKKPENKQVELFSHLYSNPRRTTLEGAHKDVHPSVLALGFQIASYEICGSSARCVAMLLAFKDAISSYSTPSGTSLARHMTSHYLSPQIDFLKSCRPISESQGNAIRWLKKLIISIDPSTPESEAKTELTTAIDTFIRERITVSDTVIAASAAKQIKPNATVLTFAKSSLVEKTILHAHQTLGTPFRVTIVDSRPLFEGKNLATTLMRAGLEVTYLPFSGIAHAVKDASLVLLGAHSMLSNGRLQSRVGTASLATAASIADVPVIVCCESVKFSGKVALDSVVLNEVAPADELLLPATASPAASTKANATAAVGGGGSEDDEAKKEKTLADWQGVPNLQLLNLMYDVTPAEAVRMVICEYGSLPPSSVPVVHRIANEGV
ncbi:hypothetical protein MBLNU230_g4551t1 [Neophaeotheca triangularis]